MDRNLLSRLLADGAAWIVYIGHRTRVWGTYGYISLAFGSDPSFTFNRVQLVCAFANNMAAQSFAIAAVPMTCRGHIMCVLKFVCGKL